MKAQDILFLILFTIMLLISRNYKLLLGSALIMTIFAMPLFYFWIFFTAQRLIYYAVAFIFVSAILMLAKKG